MNVIKILPITDLATEMHNPMIKDQKEIILNDRKLNISVPCNISVFVTNQCPNKCEWCINKNHSNENIDNIGEFDKSFNYLLNDLQLINRKTKSQNFEITLTGGEPLLIPNLFISFVNNCFMYQIPIRTVSTTGINIISNDSKLMDLFGTEVKYPMYKFMIDHDAIYNINISMHSTNPEHNAAIFGVDKEPLSIEDLGKISEIFRLYRGEVRASCNIAPHEKYGIHDNFMDIIDYIHCLYKEGVKSFIFREIVGSERSRDCMRKLSKYITENCKKIAALYLGNNKNISIYKMTDVTIGEEFLVKVYNTIGDIELPGWHKSRLAYFREILELTLPVYCKEAIEDPVYSNLVFRNGKLYTDFDCKDLIKEYTI